MQAQSQDAGSPPAQAAHQAQPQVQQEAAPAKTEARTRKLRRNVQRSPTRAWLPVAPRHRIMCLSKLISVEVLILGKVLVLLEVLGYLVFIDFER